ncbi:MAG: VOC family protein [Kordiimonas sp.]
MKLGFVVVYVDDVEKCLEFYRDAFDLKIRLKYEDDGILLYGEMETEGAVLGFSSHALGQLNLEGKYQKVSTKSDPFGQEIVFVSDDVQAAYDKAISAGAISIASPHEKPWGQTVAFLRAIEGTLIEICSPMGE